MNNLELNCIDLLVSCFYFIFLWLTNYHAMKINLESICSINFVGVMFEFSSRVIYRGIILQCENQGFIIFFILAWSFSTLDMVSSS